VDGRGAGRGGRPEAVYWKVYKAVESRRPISAAYHDYPRLFCPHRLGRNSKGERRVLCYQYGGESESGLGPPGSPSNWRCIALEELSKLKLLRGPWRTAPNHSRPTYCIVDVDIDADDQSDRDPQNGQ
jgi:hypothetical protein